jgi:TolB protein
MIVYATEVGDRGVLAAVSTDGRVRLRLSASGADVREPAWGVLPK